MKRFQRLQASGTRLLAPVMYLCVCVGVVLLQGAAHATAVPRPDKEKSAKGSKYQTFEEAWGVGVAFYNARNFESATEPLEAALDLAADDATKLRVYEALVACYRLQPKTGDMTTAVEFILKHSTRDAQKSLTRRSYLSFLYQRGQIDAAVERYEKQLKKNPEDFVSLYLLSEIYANIQRKPERATEMMERLNRIAPVSKDDPAALQKQGQLARQYIQAKDYQKGADLYEELASKDAVLAGYYLKEAALAQQKLGNTAKALELAQQAVEAGADKRNDQLTYFWNRQLGDFFLEHGDPALAATLYREALTKTQIEGYLKETQARLDEAERKIKG